MPKSYLFLYGIISFLVIILQGCVSLPSDVIMPQWDTDLNLPIATKNYTLNDIIKSQNYISVNSQDGTYLIASDSLKQSVAISNFIKINSVSSSQSATVITDGTSIAETYVQFPEGVKLIQAGITKGNFNIVAQNISPASAILTINIPGIKKNGNPLPIIVSVPANSTVSPVFDLSNCQYVQPPNQAVSKDGQLWVNARATSSSSGLINVSVTTSDFIFSSATGYLPTKSLGTHSSQFPLNLGDASDYRNKVILKSGSLALNGKYKSISSNPFIVGINNLHLVGKRNDSQLTDTLKFTDPSSNSFRFDASGNYSTVYDETNSNITSFITFLPDSIYVSADYIMNPDNDPAYKTVRDDDSISFTTRFTSKSILKINRVTFADTTDIEIDQDKRDQIVDGKGAQLTVDIKNAIPLNSWIKVTLTDKDYNPILINGSPFVITRNSVGVDSISIPGSQTDNNGNFISATPSTSTIKLDSVQIRHFAQTAQHAIISVSVETSNSTYPVIVHAADWISLNVFGRVSYTIKNKD
jgi:hypothetical protein